MFSCDICATNFELSQLSVLRCGHGFHAECLKKCLVVNPVCIRCRAPVIANEVIQQVFVDGAEESDSPPTTPSCEPTTTNSQVNTPEVDLVAALLEQNDIFRNAAQQRATGPVRSQDSNELTTVRSQPHNTEREPQGDWRVNEKLSGSSPLWVIAHGDSTLVISINRVELFTNSAISTNITPEAIFTDDRFEKFLPPPHSRSYVDLFLNSDTIVYRSLYDVSAVVVLDLSSSRSVAGLHFESEVCEIITSGVDVFAVMLFNRKTFIYRCLPNNLHRRLAEFRLVYAAALSANGIFAHDQRNGRIHLYDAVNEREIGTISPGFANFHFRINEAGTRLAVQQQEGPLRMYDVTTKEPIFECETVGFGNLARNCFSADARFAAFQGKWQLTILSLNGAPRRNFFHIPAHESKIFAFSPVFRQINGVHHFQYVMKDGTMNMYKFDESEQQWRPVT